MCKEKTCSPSQVILCHDQNKQHHSESSDPHSTHCADFKVTDSSASSERVNLMFMFCWCRSCGWGSLGLCLKMINSQCRLQVWMHFHRFHQRITPSAGQGPASLSSSSVFGKITQHLPKHCAKSFCSYGMVRALQSGLLFIITSSGHSYPFG